MRPYEVYTGEQLKIAELIQRRRLQILVHSYLYYGIDTNIVSDHTFDMWEVELVKLQTQYPEIAANVAYADAFAGWEGSSGAFLPYSRPDIEQKARRVLREHQKKKETSATAIKVAQPKLIPPKPMPAQKPARKKLF